MDIVESVVARNEAGKHPRIGRIDIRTDQRQPNPGHWLHAETT